MRANSTLYPNARAMVRSGQRWNAKVEGLPNALSVLASAEALLIFHLVKQSNCYQEKNSEPQDPVTVAD